MWPWRSGVQIPSPTPIPTLVALRTSGSRRSLALGGLIVLALLCGAILACSSDDPAEASPTAEASATNALGATNIEALTDSLGTPDSIEERLDGSVLLHWLVPVSSAERVAEDLVASFAANPTFIPTATQITSRGAVLAFSGERSGHFLVARSTEQGTRVELTLEPPEAAVVPTGTAVALPAGYPVDVLPLFPGATVTSGGVNTLDEGGRRFELELQSDRAAVEVLGFYADLLEADGWTVTLLPHSIEATRAERPRDHITLLDLELQPTTLALEFVQAP